MSDGEETYRRMLIGACENLDEVFVRWRTVDDREACARGRVNSVIGDIAVIGNRQEKSRAHIPSISHLIVEKDGEDEG